MNNPVGCVDQAATIISDKWTPQLLRALANCDSIHFCELQTAAGNLNPRTLSARLNKLEIAGIVVRTATESGRSHYQLTSKGRDLLPILRSMQTWSETYA